MIRVQTDRERFFATHTFGGADVWSVLKLRSERSSDCPYLIWHPYEGIGRTWTYAEFIRDVTAVAAGLARRGVQVGDRVLIHLENSPEFVISWYACAALGAVAVTTNTRSAFAEMQYFADDCGAVGAITQPKFADLVATSAPQLHWLAVTDNDSGAITEARVLGEPFQSLFEDPDSLPQRPIDPVAPMSVQYTSGTTSRPKGVLWTHANALWGARVNAVHEDLHPDDCHLTYLPLFHTNALAYSMLASMWVGARFVVVPKWSSGRFWSVSERYSCTWLSLIGLSYRALSDSEVPERHSYRLFGTGICDTPIDSKYGVKTLGWWGMTETISHGTVGNPYMPDSPMSIGRPAPEYGIAVVRDDGVTPTETDETGNLLCRGIPGLSMFAEYLNQPQATSDSFDERGWFRTGDLVRLEADGYLYFVDRAKDMLKVGAENVAASEVERVILGTGLVSEAAVVGRPDNKLDEVPVAFVVPTSDPDMVPNLVMQACTLQLADFKVPRAVYTVKSLPRSTLSKISKIELRRIAAGQMDKDSAERRWLMEASDDPSGDATESAS